MGKNTKRGRVKRDWKNQNAQNLRLSALKRTDNKNTKLRDAAVQRHLYENIAAQKEKDEAIRELKQRRVVCPVCGKDIEDMASAVVEACQEGYDAASTRTVYETEDDLRTKIAKVAALYGADGVQREYLRYFPFGPVRQNLYIINHLL